MSVSEDASTPAVAATAGGSSATSLTTASFSPPSGSVLIAELQVNYGSFPGSPPTLTVTDSAGGTWTIGGSQLNDASGTGTIQAMFTRPVASAPGSIAVTMGRGSDATGAMLRCAVRVLDGASLSAPAGADNTALSTATADEVTLTPTVIGSLVYVAAIHGSSAAVTPAGTTTTISSVQDSSDGGTLSVGRSTSATSSLTSTTYGWTHSGSVASAVIALEIVPSTGATVALTAPNVALAAPLVAPSGGGAVALTAPNIALAAPLVATAVLKTVALTAPNLALAAPLLTPSAGATVTLTAPNLALAAPALSASGAKTVALTAPNIALAAPLVAPAVVLAFPAVPLDLRCELLLGGTWTDVSSYVYQREGTSPPVSITRGRPDETQQAVPSRAAWQWNNRDGRFSPKNPLSPYYGQLMRNTPVRFSVPATGSYLRLEADTGDYATAADNANLHVTGSIEMRIALRLSDWQGCVLAHKWDGGSCWAWQLNGDGTLTFFWLDSGVVEHVVVSATPLPYAIGDFALKVTLDVTTGTVTYYTAASIDGTYTQVEAGASGTGGAATTLRSTTAPLSVGYEAVKIFSPDQLLGRVYEYRLYNGIGGTLKADAIFTAQAAGTTSWTDAQGNSWSLSGAAEISARDYRYHGLMSSQPPKWDVTGNDMYVAAQAGGPLRIMSQGSAPPVQSPMKRAILAQPGSLAPVAYWPMEDAAGATQFGSALGGPAMTWTGGPPALASSSPFLCSAPLPAMGTGASGAGLQGFVPSYTAGGGGTWTVRFLADIGTLPASGEPTICQVDCIGGLAAYVVMAATSAGLVQLVAYDNALNVLADTGLHSWPGLQGPLWWSIEAQPSGGNVQYSLVSLAPGASSAQVINATTSATGIAGYVAQVLPVTGGGWPDTVTGHLQVQSAWVSLFSLAGPLDAWQGEAAGNRYARLAAENGYAVRIKGSPSVSALMGPQGAGTLATLLQECETADRGQMLEPRECAGLGYRTLASMLAQSAQLTLSYTSSQPGGTTGGADSGLDPTYDDLLARNDWTVTRGSTTGSQGASVRSALSDGSEMSTSVLGDYGDTKTVNVESDSQVADVAGWMVHAGTVDEHRWPAIPVNLARTEMAALQQAAMAVDAGDMVTVTSLPNQVLYDPARELALGFTEQLGGKHWTMEYQCVPASPYDVIILDDPVYGRVDTDGSTLAAGVTSAATTLSVATTGSSPLWTTAAADFPFDVNIAGERVTVTNITGAASPQTFTVTRAVNGASKAQASGADVRLWFPTILALA